MLSGAIFLAHAVALSREVLVFVTVLASVALSVNRCHKAGEIYASRPSSVISKNIAILGTNQLSYALSQQFLTTNQSHFNFVGFLEFAGCRFSSQLSPGSVIGNISDLNEIKARCFLEAIAIAEFYPYEKTLGLLKTAHELDLDVFSIAGYYDDLTAGSRLSTLGYSQSPRCT